MTRFLLITAAFLVLLYGCGKEEEQPQPKPAEETTAQESTGVTEGAPAEEAMTPAQPPMGESTAPTEEPAPPAEGAAPGTTTEGAAGSAQQAEQPAAAPAQAVAMTGKQVYESTCFACHAEGITGAPKFGDKAAWEPRIAQGMDVLVSHVINGFQGATGMMPPKGGNLKLSDEEVRAGVSYMVEQVK